jgi:hypothetical protein
MTYISKGVDESLKETKGDDNSPPQLHAVFFSKISFGSENR